MEWSPSIAIDSINVSMVGQQKADDVHLCGVLKACYMERSLAFLIFKINEASIFCHFYLHMHRPDVSPL